MWRSDGLDQVFYHLIPLLLPGFLNLLQLGLGLFVSILFCCLVATLLLLELV